MKKLLIATLATLTLQTAYADYTCIDQSNNTIYLDTKLNTITLINHTVPLLKNDNGEYYKKFKNERIGFYSDDWINQRGHYVYIAGVISKSNLSAFGIYNTVTQKLEMQIVARCTNDKRG